MELMFDLCAPIGLSSLSNTFLVSYKCPAYVFVNRTSKNMKTHTFGNMVMPKSEFRKDAHRTRIDNYLRGPSSSVVRTLWGHLIKRISLPWHFPTRRFCDPNFPKRMAAESLNSRWTLGWGATKLRRILSTLCPGSFACPTSYCSLDFSYCRNLRPGFFVPLYSCTSDAVFFVLKSCSIFWLLQ